jgi:hypothetical protein
MSLTGTWNISISTPIGTQSVVLELTENDGVIEGIAKGNAESTPLINPVLDGNRPGKCTEGRRYHWEVLHQEGQGPLTRHLLRCGGTGAALADEYQACWAPIAGESEKTRFRGEISTMNTLSER